MVSFGTPQNPTGLAAFPLRIIIAISVALVVVGIIVIVKYGRVDDRHKEYEPVVVIIRTARVARRRLAGLPKFRLPLGARPLMRGTAL